MPFSELQDPNPSDKPGLNPNRSTIQPKGCSNPCGGVPSSAFRRRTRSLQTLPTVSTVQLLLFARGLSDSGVMPSPLAVIAAEFQQDNAFGDAEASRGLRTGAGTLPTWCFLLESQSSLHEASYQGSLTPGAFATPQTLRHRKRIGSNADFGMVSL